MAKVGFLKNIENVLKGEVRTLQMYMKVELHKVGNKRTPDSPDYVVQAVANGGRVEIGSAWKKQSNGTDFITIAMDDPSFPHPLNLTGFKSDNPEYALDIVYRRPKQQQNTNTEQLAAA